MSGMFGVGGDIKTTTEILDFVQNDGIEAAGSEEV